MMRKGTVVIWVIAGCVCVLCGVSTRAEESSTEVMVIGPAPMRRVTADEVAGLYGQSPQSATAAAARVRSASWVRDATAMRAMREQRMQQMADRLNLNPDQRKRVQALFEEMGQQFHGWRSDPAQQEAWRNMSPEERRAQFQQRREQFRARLSEVLTEEQMQQADAMREEFHGHFGRRRGPEGPPPGQ